MKRSIGIGLVLVAGIAGAAPMEKAAAAFAKATDGGKTNVAQFATMLAMPEGTLRGIVDAGWDEVAFIQGAFAGGGNAAGSLDWLAAKDGFSGAGKDAIVQGVLDRGGRGESIQAVRALKHLPVEKREPLRDLVAQHYRQVYVGQPVRAALTTKYAMMNGDGGPSFDQATVDELVSLRLAPELRAGDEAGLILERATVAAKKALRAEGKSFVVGTNGVNPLVAKIQPVVDALNAPAAAGIEAALAGCGIQIANQDRARAALAVKVSAWRDAILNGEVAPNAQTPYLNALKVGLGIKEYNLMIDAYNNGTGR